MVRAEHAQHLEAVEKNVQEYRKLVYPGEHLGVVRRARDRDTSSISKPTLPSSLRIRRSEFTRKKVANTSLVATRYWTGLRSRMIK